jgi:hypothetical protein
MSKFIALCEKVETFLKEQGEVPQPAPNADPNAAVPPGQSIEQPQATLDPNTQSEINDVSNDKIEELIETIVNFYQKGKALSSESVKEISLLPSKITSENSQETVESLLNIFNKSDMPIDSSDTSE